MMPYRNQTLSKIQELRWLSVTVDRLRSTDTSTTTLVRCYQCLSPALPGGNLSKRTEGRSVWRAADAVKRPQAQNSVGNAGSPQVLATLKARRTANGGLP